VSVKDKVIIYCDGACSGNQFKSNAGGWGAILKYKDHVKEIHGGELNTTNQRMEITACIKALEQLNSTAYPVEIYTDSSYLANCMLQRWYFKWQRNGWQNASRKPVENRDLWERLLELLEGRRVTFHKVKGHAGDTLNELADELARMGIDEARKAHSK
jgi:ribonuclease HI